MTSTCSFSVLSVVSVQVFMKPQDEVIRAHIQLKNAVFIFLIIFFSKGDFQLGLLIDTVHDTVPQPVVLV